ncbi:MAG: hypothetical protein R3F11_13405 [Verrucomicrobiales bacterium]
MDVQVATLCDSAMDYNGKLCVLGTFDTICSRGTPIIHPQCSLALRICFRPGDEGTHQFEIALIDADGQLVRHQAPGKFGEPEMNPTLHLRPKINIRFPGEDSYFITRNIVLNLQRLKLDEAGQYSIDVSVDGEILTRVPLRVMLVEERGTAEA